MQQLTLVGGPVDGRTVQLPSGITGIHVPSFMKGQDGIAVYGLTGAFEGLLPWPASYGRSCDCCGAE